MRYEPSSCWTGRPFRRRMLERWRQARFKRRNLATKLRYDRERCPERVARGLVVIEHQIGKFFLGERRREPSDDQA